MKMGRELESGSMAEQWSSLERLCLSLLQHKNTRLSLLQIHAFILRNALETNPKLLASFISAAASLPFSASAGLTRHSRVMFEKSPHRPRGDSFLCSTAIKAEKFPDSLALYRDLRRDTCFVPNGYTFLVLVKSCASNMAVREGGEIHNHVLKSGFCSNLFVATALVEMYARSGYLVCSRKLFDELVEKDSAVVNVMIDGYAKSGDMVSARDLFQKIPPEMRNVVTWTSLVHGYCHSGDIESAKSLFDVMPVKNLVSWNAMISGYCKNDRPREALRLFHEIRAETPLEPDEVTIVSILSAIGILGALDLGFWVHRFVQMKRFDKLANIRTALVDMYAKCGEVSRARRVFDETLPKEIALWNAMINGLALNGRGEEALELFSKMLRENLNPNGVTILGVLLACNHSGLVEEGKRWFGAMKRFGLVPQIEHYGCMVDLLGKAGLLEEAERLIEEMPHEANGVILSSFLSSCRNFDDVARAEKYLGEAVSLEPWNDGNYVTVRNLYASELRWTNAETVKRLMKSNGVNKEVGCSTIEVRGMVSEFFCGNRSHPEWDRIDSVLVKLRKHMRGDIFSCLIC